MLLYASRSSIVLLSGLAQYMITLFPFSITRNVPYWNTARCIL